MSDTENRMLELAKKWMLEYFSDGKARMPSDFDEDFLGGVDVMGTLGVSALKWNNTPFVYALGDLVRSGAVDYWQDEEGHCLYKINTKNDDEEEQ